MLVYHFDLTMKVARAMNTVTAERTLPPKMSPAHVAEAMPHVRLIDVRSDSEFRKFHIPGSYNIPLEVIAEHGRRIGSAVSCPVVLVCSSGMRAKHARDILADAGMTRLHVLRGGFMAWKSSGRDVARSPNDKWEMERQVRAVAGSLVLTGALGGLLVNRWVGMLAVGVGGGLVTAAATNTCTMARLLAKLPYNRSEVFDLDKVLESLQDQSAAFANAA